jgi:hypothetical protein
VGSEMCIRDSIYIYIYIYGNGHRAIHSGTVG